MKRQRCKDTGARRRLCVKCLGPHQDLANGNATAVAALVMRNHGDYVSVLADLLLRVRAESEGLTVEGTRQYELGGLMQAWPEHNVMQKA